MTCDCDRKPENKALRDLLVPEDFVRWYPVPCDRITYNCRNDASEETSKARGRSVHGLVKRFAEQYILTDISMLCHRYSQLTSACLFFVGTTLTRVIEAPITITVREKSDMRAIFFLRETLTFQSITMGIVMTFQIRQHFPVRQRSTHSLSR